MIASLDEYRAAEEELKRLLASFAASPDLIDQGALTQDGGDWKGTETKMTALKADMENYRQTHPEEFQS